MGTVKRFSGDYVMTAVDAGSITFDTPDLILTGNIAVGGNTTVISTTHLSISDNSIVLNAGEVGAGVTLNVAGIEIDRGSEANVFMQYNDTINSWEMTNDGITYLTIVSSATGFTELADDATPQLANNLDVGGFIINSTTGNVAISGNLALIHSTAPTVSTASVAGLVASTIGVGGTGLSVTNGTEINEELISKKKAVGLGFLL
jgi:hypothetical protein